VLRPTRKGADQSNVRPVTGDDSYRVDRKSKRDIASQCSGPLETGYIKSHDMLLYTHGSRVPVFLGLDLRNSVPIKSPGIGTEFRSGKFPRRTRCSNAGHVSQGSERRTRG
jgi:hypothetical protein